MSIDYVKELAKEIVEKFLKELKGGKIKTIDFVNNVIDEVKKHIQIDEDTEITVRPYIVDVLWEYHKKKIIKFDSDLLNFDVVAKAFDTSSIGISKIVLITFLT